MRIADTVLSVGIRESQLMEAAAKREKPKAGHTGSHDIPVLPETTSWSKPL